MKLPQGKTQLISSYLYRVCAAVFLFCSPFVTCSSNTISFDDAVNRTLSLSPALRIVSSEVDARAGDQIQSGLLPNPVAAYSVENVFGNKNWRGWRSAESRYEVGQLIELGGKRDHRYQTASFQYYASIAGKDAKQLSVLNRLFKLFVLASASQENLTIALDKAKIAEEVYTTVAAKVEAGKVSLIQQSKAEIEFLTAKINLEKANIDFLKNKERLALLWGDSCPDFDRVDFPFFTIQAPASLDICLSDLVVNPELVQSLMEHRAAIHNLNLEKSLAVPDVTVTLGYKSLRETGDKGMILGASFPIPAFNRNQGNIQRARAQTVKTRDQYHELELALESKLMISHKELIRAYDETERIRTTVLKVAELSFELAKIGYQEGKFEYLDMLDSQKTLFEIRERFLQSLLNYHERFADIVYLNTQDEGL